MHKLSILLFLFITFFSIGCSHSQSKSESDAKILTDEANQLQINYDPKKESRSNVNESAITLLNKAISKDSTYLEAYCEKLIAQNSLKKFVEALVTAKQMIKIRPEVYYVNTQVGMAYDRTGDTATAITYYKKALVIVNKLLDNMG